jgi:DNA helicase-2/ATP-dependent DNA helicase PcrA
VNEDLPVAAALEASRFDDRQRAVLEHGRDSLLPLLVVGGAGCGKTTVALHRLAHLHAAAPDELPERALLVVMPEGALARRAQQILAGLHLHRVACHPFDEWIAGEARRVFADLPARESDDRSAAVIAFKRHPALRPVLRALVDDLGLAMARRLDSALSARGRLLAAWPSVPGAHLRARLDQLEGEVLRDTDPPLVRETTAAFARERERLWAVREDLLELFGDRRRLAEAVAASGGELLPGMTAAVLAHTQVQFTETAEEEYAHVDADRLRTVDHRTLDAGTPLEDAGSVDPEDFAVCFELLWLKTGGQQTPAGALRPHQAMVVDEAQDLSAIELAALGRALAPAGALTVCGDPMQQIDADARFAGWDETLRVLVDRPFTRIELRTSYRCTAEIAAYAAAVLGPLAPPELPGAARSGVPVVRDEVADDGELVARLAPRLAALRERAPTTAVAVICRKPATALRLHRLLPPALHARLALSGDLTITPGLQVTTVAQAKGMELDVVVVPDADAATYPDDPAARRTLYVACTRARDELWVLAPPAPSPLLPW